MRAPWHVDSPRVDALFPAASYQYVWLGMQGHQPGTGKLAARSIPPRTLKGLDRALHEVREKSLRLRQSMPGNRALLNALTGEAPPRNLSNNAVEAAAP